MIRWPPKPPETSHATGGPRPTFQFEGDVKVRQALARIVAANIDTRKGTTMADSKLEQLVRNCNAKSADDIKAACFGFTLGGAYMPPVGARGVHDSKHPMYRFEVPWDEGTGEILERVIAINKGGTYNHLAKECEWLLDAWREWRATKDDWVDDMAQEARKIWHGELASRFSHWENVSPELRQDWRRIVIKIHDATIDRLLEESRRDAYWVHRDEVRGMKLGVPDAAE